MAGRHQARPQPHASTRDRVSVLPRGIRTDHLQQRQEKDRQPTAPWRPCQAFRCGRRRPRAFGDSPTPRRQVPGPGASLLPPPAQGALARTPAYQAQATDERQHSARGGDPTVRSRSTHLHPHRRPPGPLHPPRRLQPPPHLHHVPQEPHPPRPTRHREDLHRPPDRLVPDRPQGRRPHRDGPVPPVLRLRGLRRGLQAHRKGRVHPQTRRLPPFLRTRTRQPGNPPRLHHRRDQPGQPVTHLRRAPHADRARQAERGLRRRADLFRKAVPRPRERPHPRHDEHRGPVANSAAASRSATATSSPTTATSPPKTGTGASWTPRSPPSSASTGSIRRKMSRRPWPDSQPTPDLGQDPDPQRLLPPLLRVEARPGAGHEAARQPGRPLDGAGPPRQDPVHRRQPPRPPRHRPRVRGTAGGSRGHSRQAGGQRDGRNAHCGRAPGPRATSRSCRWTSFPTASSAHRSAAC